MQICRGRIYPTRKGMAVTLIEMLIVLSIMTIITAASIPSFLKFTNTARLRAAARDICTALRSARRYAITKRTTYATAVYLNDGAKIKNAVSIYETANTIEVQRFASTVYAIDHDGSEKGWLVFAFDPRGGQGSASALGWVGVWDTIRVVDPNDNYIEVKVNTATGRVRIGGINEKL